MNSHTAYLTSGDSDIIKFVITVINGVHRPDSEYKFDHMAPQTDVQ